MRKKSNKNRVAALEYALKYVENKIRESSLETQKIILEVLSGGNIEQIVKESHKS